MRCPHCHNEVKAPVNETRVYEGDVYRRRCCGRCGRSFVTREVAPAGLKMPAAVMSSRARGVAKPAPSAPKPIRTPDHAAHLVWGALP